LQIALNQLKPNPKNVRKVEADNLDKLIASIKSRDLLHNLVVQKNGTGYWVVDGHRRFQALCKIHGSKSDFMVDCKVIEEGATEIGAMANMMREGMHPLDEADAINQVAQDGEMDYDQIAANWGQTRKWVMQRVALSELSEKVKDGFRNKEFGMVVAQLFTRVNHKSQDEIYDKCNGNYNHGYIERMIGNIKVLRDDVIIPKTHKLYKEIEFIGDLFSDNQYVADVTKMMTLQKQYVDDKAKAMAKLYKDCVVIDCYPSEKQGLLKNLVQVSADEAKELDNKDINVIISYMPERGDLWIMKYKSKVEMSKKELDAIENGEIPELTLADMSNPQREMTNTMYYNYLRDEFWKAGDGYSSGPGHVALAMICNNIVRPSYYSDDYQDVEKYFVTYTDTPFNKVTGVDDDYFDNLTQEIIKYCKTHKCNSLEYFLSKTIHDLYPILYKGLVASMGEGHAFRSQKDHYHLPIAKDWFKPTEEWLNKYKITQLRLLANKIKCDLLPTDNKKMVMDKLIVAFENGAVFDPIKFLDTVK
jgi:ParB/RepB/Spo0J family partition protein